MKSIFAALAGLIFGLGLVILGMANPAKVQNFLDIFGTWDPSLAFVMGGAVIVTFIGYRLVWRRDAPLFEGRFQVPTSATIDARWPRSRFVRRVCCLIDVAELAGVHKNQP